MRGFVKKALGLPLKNRAKRMSGSQLKPRKKFFQPYRGTIQSPDIASISSTKMQLQKTRRISTESETVILDKKNTPTIASLLAHPRFKTVFVLNRGLVAVEIIEAVKKQGLRAVLLSLPEDEHSLAASLADKVLLISDHMNMQEIIGVLDVFRDQDSLPGAYAVHTGYGYLSEISAFSALCYKHGFIFVGPAADPMEQIGAKGKGKQFAKAHGLKVLGGYEGADQSSKTLLKAANALGYPLMIKTDDGGAGKGNRVVHTEAEATLYFELFAAAKRNVILEKICRDFGYLEVQFFIDENGNVVILGTRNTVVQVDGAKKIEEAPALIPEIEEDQIERISTQLSDALRKIGYKNAVTAEFFIVKVNGQWTLVSCEFNTRMQVEWGVTAALYGHFISIPELQLHIAQHGTLDDYFKKAYQACFGHAPKKNLTAQHMADAIKKAVATKHAVEFRVEAVEATTQEKGIQFNGVRGEIRYVLPVVDPKIGRVSTGVAQYEKINTTQVNPLIMTVIGHGKDRAEAIQHAVDILKQVTIEGVQTNKEYLLHFAEHPRFLKGDLTNTEVDAIHAEFAAAMVISAMMLNQPVFMGMNHHY